MDQFWSGGASGAPALLDQKVAEVQTGRAWDTYDLSPNLLDHSLASGVDVVFTAVNPHSEAHLYARDPREMKDTFTSLANAFAFQIDPQTWADQTAPGTLPQSVVLEPNMFTLANMRHLDTSAFFEAPPAGAAATPSGGSVKAARVYDHGACSYIFDTTGGGQGLLDTLQTQFYDTFVEKALHTSTAATYGFGDLTRTVGGDACYSDVHPTVITSQAVNYLDHRAGEVADLRGGFFWNLHYHVGVPSPADDIDTQWTAWYEYGLDDGVLTLTHPYAQGFTTGHNDALIQYELANALTRCDPALVPLGCVDLPTKFKAFAKQQQTGNILGDDEPGFTPCFPEDTDPCGTWVPVKVPEALQLGEDAMTSSGDPTFVEDANTLDADTKAMTAALTRRTDGLLQDWTCVPDTSEQIAKHHTPQKHHCEFAIPSKRLNVYPDAIELVWFDGKEVNNAAYAVYVIAHAGKPDPTSGLTPVDALCSFKQEYFGTPRRFEISSPSLTEQAARAEVCNGLDATTAGCSTTSKPPGDSGERSWPVMLLGVGLLALARASARRRRP